MIKKGEEVQRYFSVGAVFDQGQKFPVGFLSVFEVERPFVANTQKIELVDLRRNVQETAAFGF